MTKKILLAGLLGGLAMFVWSSIAHMALPLGEAGISQMEDEKPVLDALKAGVKDTPGLYIFPAMPKGMSETQYTEKLAAMPSGILLYSRAGAQALTPRQLVVEFLVECLEALLLAFLLTRTNLTGFGPQFGFVLAASLMATIWTNTSYLNWYNFPATYTMAYWFTEFAGLLLAGLVVMKIVGRKGHA